MFYGYGHCGFCAGDPVNEIEYYCADHAHRVIEVLGVSR